MYIKLTRIGLVPFSIFWIQILELIPIFMRIYLLDNLNRISIDKWTQQKRTASTWKKRIDHNLSRKKIFAAQDSMSSNPTYCKEQYCHL